MRRWSISPATVRDWLLLLGGMAGVAHETLINHADRPWLLALLGGMMGLPSALKVGRTDPPPAPSPPSSPDTSSPPGTPPS